MLLFVVGCCVVGGGRGGGEEEVLGPQLQKMQFCRAGRGSLISYRELS